MLDLVIQTVAQLLALWLQAEASNCGRLMLRVVEDVCDSCRLLLVQCLNSEYCTVSSRLVLEGQLMRMWAMLSTEGLPAVTGWICRDRVVGLAVGMQCCQLHWLLLQYRTDVLQGSKAIRSSDYGQWIQVKDRYWGSGGRAVESRRREGSGGKEKLGEIWYLLLPMQNCALEHRNWLVQSAPCCWAYCRWMAQLTIFACGSTQSICQLLPSPQMANLPTMYNLHSLQLEICNAGDLYTYSMPFSPISMKYSHTPCASTPTLSPQHPPASALTPSPAQPCSGCPPRSTTTPLRASPYTLYGPTLSAMATMSIWDCWQQVDSNDSYSTAVVIIFPVSTFTENTLQKLLCPEGGVLALRWQCLQMTLCDCFPVRLYTRVSADSSQYSYSCGRAVTPLSYNQDWPLLYMRTTCTISPLSVLQHTMTLQSANQFPTLKQLTDSSAYSHVLLGSCLAKVADFRGFDDQLLMLQKDRVKVVEVSEWEMCSGQGVPCTAVEKFSCGQLWVGVMMGVDVMMGAGVQARV